MKKILLLSMLINIAFALSAQSLIGNKVKSKEAVLVYLVEQEKLARDVYSTLDTFWVTDVFNRLAHQELQHIGKLSTVAAELAIYVPNHFNEYPLGQFNNPEFRILYKEILENANFSLEDAYRVCANLEERKMMDLKAALKEPNFEMENLTYKSLLLGSEENFKIFVQALIEMNSYYTPIWLSPAEFESLSRNILANDTGKILPSSVKTPIQIGMF